MRSEYSVSDKFLILWKWTDFFTPKFSSESNSKSFSRWLVKGYFQLCRLHLLMLMNDILPCPTHSHRFPKNPPGFPRHFPAFRSGTSGRVQSNYVSRDGPDFPVGISSSTSCSFSNQSVSRWSWALLWWFERANEPSWDRSDLYQRDTLPEALRGPKLLSLSTVVGSVLSPASP